MYLDRTHHRAAGRLFQAIGAAFATVVALSSPALAKDDLKLELNKLETAGANCQAYFLIEEQAGKALQSLKADLIVFGKDGSISKRLIAEMGPIRTKKTSVKIFAIDVPCAEISGVLLNDVASCAPDATPEACLDRLVVSSRLPIRFYK